MEKQISFSSRIDVERYHCFHFILTSLDSQADNIEISADYGPSHNEPELIYADVWAGIEGDMFKRFLYTAKLPLSKHRLDDYAGIAKSVYHDPKFLAALQEFTTWAYKNKRK